MKAFSIVLFLFLDDEIVAGSFQPNYTEVLQLSLLFFESQRSGKLPDSNKIKWRGDSALNDTGLNREDLSGGYYDSSDFVKFGFTMAFATTILSWGVISSEESYLQTGLHQEVLEAIKWSTDYFIKCHTKKYEFYGQVGDFALDHQFWGRPEEMNMSRPAFKIDQDHPGSDLAAEASATFSAASIVFKKVNATYSRLLLGHAVELLEFAKKYRGLYQDVIPGAKEYYKSKSYGDELIWSSTWLYKATNDTKYLEDALKFYREFNISLEIADRFFYNNKIIGIELLLAASSNNSEHISRVTSFCDHMIDHHRKTPKGLLYIDKPATLPHAANVAFICLKAADLPEVDRNKYVAFAKKQIDYMLGSTGRSYVTGYGVDFPKKPFHSGSSCPDLPQPCGWQYFYTSSPNQQVLFGALVSGPDSNDYYQDDRQEFLYNEVALDFNAAFQSVLAGLIHYFRVN